MKSLYEHAGGEEALHHLEEIFYEKALADPILRTLFRKRVHTHVEHLTCSPPSRSAAPTASLNASASSRSSTPTAT